MDGLSCLFRRVAPANEAELVLVDDRQQRRVGRATVAEDYFLLICLAAPPDGLRGRWHRAWFT